MMKNLIGFGAVALLLATAIPAFAQENAAPEPGTDQTQMADRGRDGGHHGGREHGKRYRMQIIDANGDGVIGDDEAAALADRAFNRIDADANGDISVDEFSTVRGPRSWRAWMGGGAQNDAMVQGLKTKFATLDANKDGKLTKTEFMTDAQARLVAADANKDGKVSPWEFRAQN